MTGLPICVTVRLLYNNPIMLSYNPYVIQGPNNINKFFLMGPSSDEWNMNL